VLTAASPPVPQDVKKRRYVRGATSGATSGATREEQGKGSKRIRTESGKMVDMGKLDKGIYKR
jgi:hypothetical protein